MKSFGEFFCDKSLPTLIEQVALKAVQLNLSEQDVAQGIVSHFSKTDDEKSKVFITLMEDQMGLGAKIGQGIGNFVGGGIGGIAKGLQQGWKSNFGGNNGVANAKGQAQNANGQEPVTAEEVPLNQQQVAALKGQVQSLQNIQNIMQQAGLQGYSNYLAKLNQSLTSQLQQAQQNMTAQPAQSNARQQFFPMT